MDVQHGFEAIKQILTSSSLFYVQASERKLMVTRQRKFTPRRGAFRILLPHSCVIVKAHKNPAKPPSCLIRPDSLAIFMTVMLIGAIAVEILMDREIYPREYPPLFVYGLATIYIGGLIAEVVYTRKQLQKLLGKIEL
ncbi:MAG: hypothetical protein HC799_04500 [Limnothrix sp. RL_2_0]|nr:hypothetical protein [Limnothrix sp. RL_2_0]